MGDSSTVNINVDTSGMQSSLDASLGAMTALNDSVKNLEGYLKNIYEYTKTTRDCLVHIHDSHLHSKAHLCEDQFDVGSGSPWLYPSTSSAEKLVLEYNNNMDYDFNGLIYGRDFMITKTDKSRPPFLEQLEYIIKPSNKMKRISWSAYLKTLPKA